MESKGMKIAVAMSGGIDSSMAALLLQEEGYDIMGITAVLNDAAGNAGGDVQALPHVVLSREIAVRHGFSHHTVDLRDEFLADVVRPFCCAYLAGTTPNPCVECNAAIKFGRLLEIARSLGCDSIATGHYVRRREDGERIFLSMGLDRSKDQSYFLYRLTQEQLRHAAFPLGEHRKSEIRIMARQRALRCRDNPESQDICFLPDGDYGAFVESMAGAHGASGEVFPGGILPSSPGEILDGRGRVIGRHRGIHRYTIGQRRGLGIAAPRPLYVKAIDPLRNSITAGTRDELLTDRITVTGVCRMKALSLDGTMAMVKTRSTQPPAPARLTESGESVIVEFTEAQFGISPGQSAVFYDGESDLLGGGYIERGC
ncbi:MAG: tRNA 2-thiouridine(34) synthase MnmA [Spirochaetes bacterium]|nr:tRNA 2-thiouridine(34) synthase MnmA [Spirochaetota bacterium]